jgi:hypothetical protein
MMTEEYTTCSKCRFEKALTHWDSSGMIRWVACPRCRSFFDHDKEVHIRHERGFWKNVEHDTGYELKKINGRKVLDIKIPDFRVNMQQGKDIGNSLDKILFTMEQRKMQVPAELMELKQWLRFKGNSQREQGDDSLWEIKSPQK